MKSNSPAADMPLGEFRAAALYLFGHLSQKEIGERLGLAQQTVSDLLVAAKPKLEARGIPFLPRGEPPSSGPRRTCPIPRRLAWVG